MPVETQQAVDWALTQKVVMPWGDEYPITKDTTQDLVDKVREYFNTNKIQYSTFDYDDLVPYLSE
jgi:hypothetical protein